jgi:putative flippase GtrA
MNDFIPYFAGLITLIFSIAFSYAITDGWSFKGNKKK